jgi:D-glycero-D-manno-heptose 1,7-bisphosphate phosphatase
VKRQTLFLDRDGVINVDYAYVHRPENFEFLPGIFDLVRSANDLGYAVVVVTNQAGIGRGFYSELDFHSLTQWMLDQFRQHASRIDAVYFSPFHPEHGVGEYKRESSCRKPGPGMLLRAAEDLDLDLDRSIILGDKPSDLAAGVAAGVPHRWLLTNSVEQCDEATERVSSLQDALESFQRLTLTSEG